MIKIYLTFFFFLSVLVAPSPAQARLQVMTTVPDLKALVAEIGGEQVEVSSIAKGTQDPHYIEAKPSYMVKASHADLLIAIGLELEIGYLPLIIQGARNPKIKAGGPGYLEVGPLVEPLDVPAGKLSRSEGDVHPRGNPHVTLDPVRAGEIAVKIAAKLAELDSEHAGEFAEKAKAIQARFKSKLPSWQARVDKLAVKKVITYHKTLTYFLDRFKLANPTILEPKPGVPPTASHILEVIEVARKQKVPVILIENYFDSKIAQRIRDDVPSVRITTVPVSVEGAPGITRLDDLYEALVSAVEGK